MKSWMTCFPEIKHMIKTMVMVYSKRRERIFNINKDDYSRPFLLP